MIFVSTGTQFPFDRMLEAIDLLLSEGIITELVIAQTSHGSSFVSPRMECIESISGDRFDQYISEARIVISHAGMGTILSALMHQKPIITIPRKAELGEHRNNHQFDSLEKIHNPAIIKCWDTSNLKQAFDEANQQEKNTTKTQINDLSLAVMNMLQ